MSKRASANISATRLSAFLIASATIACGADSSDGLAEGAASTNQALEKGETTSPDGSSDTVQRTKGQAYDECVDTCGIIMDEWTSGQCSSYCFCTEIEGNPADACRVDTVQLTEGQDDTTSPDGSSDTVQKSKGQLYDDCVVTCGDIMDEWTSGQCSSYCFCTMIEGNPAEACWPNKVN